MEALGAESYIGIEEDRGKKDSAEECFNACYTGSAHVSMPGIGWVSIGLARSFYYNGFIWKSNSKNCYCETRGGYEAIGSCNIEIDNNYNLYSMVHPFTNPSKDNAYNTARRQYCDPNNQEQHVQFIFDNPTRYCGLCPIDFGTKWLFKCACSGCITPPFCGGDGRAMDDDPCS